MSYAKETCMQISHYNRRFTKLRLPGVMPISRGG